MALKSRSIIMVNEFLSVGEHIESRNRLYFALMQSDGNFVVSRGTLNDNRGVLWTSNVYDQHTGKFFATVQNDGNFVVSRGTPNDNRGALWASNVYDQQRTGKFFATVQDDGNFVVSRGTPNDNRGVLWASNVYDPVVDCENISSIDYDVNAAKIVHSDPVKLHRERVVNDSPQTQTSSITGSVAVSETSGWSDSLAIKVGASASFKAGIPFIAEGTVTVSLDITDTYTWNGSTTRTNTLGYNTPVSAPPHTAIVVLVSATMSTIVVPYTLKGTVIFKSGTRMLGQIGGIYTGTNSHDVTVTFRQESSSP